MADNIPRQTLMSLDALVRSLDKPIIKPIDAVWVIAGMPVSMRPKFQQAMVQIADGIRSLEEIRAQLVKGQDDGR